MKSTSCFGKKSGQALTVYDSEQEAENASEYSKNAYGNDLTPYLCDVCAGWHLSPKDRQTPSKKCDYCTGGDGQFKSLYRNRSEADMRANIILQEQEIKLYSYQCEYSSGWHLTKSRY